MTDPHLAFDYVAGALSPDAEQRFLRHLTACARCQADLGDAVQLGALETALRRAPLDALAARRRRRQIGISLAAVVAAAAGAVVYLGRAPAPVQLALAPERAIEVRLSAPFADRHRPYGVQRSAAVPEAIAPDAIAALERGGARRDVAAAYALTGERARARTELEALPASADRDSDLAALALLDGHPEEAVRLADAALRADHQHRQARWNLALALVRLQLIEAAAAQLERVRDRERDPAWAREAGERAAALRARAGDRAKAWYAARDAGYAMVRGGAPIAVDVARRFPGTSRLFLYDALRVASQPARFDQLAALAAELDRVSGTEVLSRAVAAARARPASPARAALVAEYLHFEARDSTLDERGWRAWLDRARRAGAADLMLGAMVLVDDVAAHLEEYRRLAEATGDPWFALLAAEQAGSAAAAAGKFRDAEASWRAAQERCTSAAIAYRCAIIERRLAGLYKREHRLAEARRAGRKALELALVDNEWGQALEVLGQLGDIELFGDRYAMARAYLDEAEQGAAGDCHVIGEMHRLRAQVALLERRYDAAHAELAGLAACSGEALNVNRIALVVDLARHGAPVVPEPEAIRLIAELRASDPAPTTALVADVMAARLTIDRDPRARAALSAALARGAAIDDVLARTTEATALLTLAIDDARRADWPQLFETAARPTGAPAPARCAVAIAVDDARVAVAVRNAAGAPAGRSLRRDGPLDAPTLIPDELRTELAGCADIAVLALPPVIGEPRLLPRALPWSYRIGPGRAAPATGTARRVVIADVSPPPYLDLPALATWAGTAGDVVLRGAEAHPRRVLAELADASEIEIHAHGVVDLAVSQAPVVALSPDADGTWALTGESLRGVRLARAPTVILAECRVAALTPYEAWGLPTAFIAAGARTVLASASLIDDREAGRFFDDVLAEIRAGAPAGRAVAAVARGWLARDPRSWVADVLVFD